MRTSVSHGTSNRSPSRNRLEKMWAARRAQAVIPHSDWPKIVAEYIETDVTMAQLGDRFGVTGAWIQDIVAQVDPDAFEKKRHRRREATLWARLWERCEIALAEDRRCAVCGAWVLRDRTTTCSPRHAEVWSVLRHVDDPDAHRLHQAHAHLASPEKYTEANLEWARRMLSDNPPPRNRTYLTPGSKRAEIIRQYRPELYEELTARPGRVSP